MVVDSRAKGARNEAAAKKTLIQLTGLNWQRVPGSGSLDIKHCLKGDLYIPDEKNVYAVEVKAYKEPHFNHSILLSNVSQFDKWWEQATRQGEQLMREPLLLFKHDRSKWLCVFESPTAPIAEYVYISRLRAYVCVLESWIKDDEPRFIV